MTSINYANGTHYALDSLTKAWREMHTAYLILSEINEGSYKDGQEPLEFTQNTSLELHRAMEEIRQMMAKLCQASTGAQPGHKASEAREAMCANCKGCSISR